MAVQPSRVMNVPLAPELGLFLDKAFYDSYNRRWGDDREPLDLDDFADQVADFKVGLCLRSWHSNCSWLPLVADGARSVAPSGRAKKRSAQLHTA